MMARPAFRIWLEMKPGAIDRRDSLPAPTHCESGEDFE